MKHSQHDFALILAWPETTIRGDEKWMMVFRKIGWVKNLNFKVGHTGIVLVDGKCGELHYYDFGRYIAPRGLGRARSRDSDPRLRLRTIARFDPSNDQIQNLNEICEELEILKGPFQTHGKLYFSISEKISFKRAKQYADQIVRMGSTLYGAFAPGNNNCSRFITRLLTNATQQYHRFHGIRLPETIKSSPLSNLVNARKDRQVYIYDSKWGLSTTKLSRWGSIKLLYHHLKDNFNSEACSDLADDRIIGSMEEKPRPIGLPCKAQWLGGVGEGAWYHLESTEKSSCFKVSRYTESGEIDYVRDFHCQYTFDPRLPFTFQYDSHGLWTTLEQGGNTIRMHALPVEKDSSVELSLPLRMAQNSY